MPVTIRIAIHAPATMARIPQMPKPTGVANALAIQSATRAENPYTTTITTTRNNPAMGSDRIRHGIWPTASREGALDP